MPDLVEIIYVCVYMCINHLLVNNDVQDIDEDGKILANRDKKLTCMIILRSM